MIRSDKILVMAFGICNQFARVMGYNFSMVCWKMVKKEKKSLGINTR